MLIHIAFCVATRIIYQTVPAILLSISVVIASCTMVSFSSPDSAHYYYSIHENRVHKKHQLQTQVYSYLPALLLCHHSLC